MWSFLFKIYLSLCLKHLRHILRIDFYRRDGLGKNIISYLSKIRVFWIGTYFENDPYSWKIAESRIKRRGMILILLFQVKQYSAFKKCFTPDVFGIEDYIRDEVLGQHGIQLLMERKGSFFHPGVLGILCIGTKVYMAVMTYDL